MKHIVRLLALLLTNTIFAQVSGHIKDASTQLPIPYVNIWVENQKYGTSADENGAFAIAKTESGQRLIFSAVGYENKIVSIDALTENVTLTPQSIALAEVTVTPKKKMKGKLGKIHGVDALMVNWNEDNLPHPAINAKYFPYPESTPFIHTVKVKLFSSEKEAFFNLRFYSVGENGSPAGFLYEENILCTLKKGMHKMAIDVADKHITIPENGIFVAVEYLIIDKNRREHPYSYQNKKGETIKGVTLFYEPAIIVSDVEGTPDTWSNGGGHWKKIEKYCMAMELDLTN